MEYDFPYLSGPGHGGRKDNQFNSKQAVRQLVVQKNIGGAWRAYDWEVVKAGNKPKESSRIERWLVLDDKKAARAMIVFSGTQLIETHTESDRPGHVRVQYYIEGGIPYGEAVDRDVNSPGFVSIHNIAPARASGIDTGKSR